MLAAAIQLNSGSEEERNIERAAALVAEAAGRGAELVVLPEKWNLLAPGEALAARAEGIDGRAVTAAREWAREHGIHLVAGSFAERVEGEERLANTSLLVAPDGEVAARYRKIHMFDVDVGGVSYRESEFEGPGEEITVAEAGELRVGLTVCYDLRFPELYRILALRGALVTTVPSAFTATTGRAHWEVLLRARAIENQLFVVAAGQHGRAEPHYDSWGHSMIVDPWGRVLDLCAEGEGIACADLDLDELRRVRADLPSLANRVTSAYRWPQEEISRA